MDNNYMYQTSQVQYVPNVNKKSQNTLFENSSSVVIELTEFISYASMARLKLPK
jgi:hypothetical protein